MAALVWGMLFGAIGIGYFVYGKRQGAVLPLVCGVGLMVFPYFVTGTVWILLVGAALMAAPWYWR
jgi:hypothetical protein